MLCMVRKWVVACTFAIMVRSPDLSFKVEFISRPDFCSYGMWSASDNVSCSVNQVWLEKCWCSCLSTTSISIWRQGVDVWAYWLQSSKDNLEALAARPPVSLSSRRNSVRPPSRGARRPGELGHRPRAVKHGHVTVISIRTRIPSSLPLSSL